MGAWTSEEQLTFDIAFAAQPLDLFTCQLELGSGTRLREARSINCGEQFSHVSGESRPAPCGYQHYCLFQ